MRIQLLSWLFLIPFLENFFGIDMVLVAGECQSDQQSSLLQLKRSLRFDVNQSVHLVKWGQNIDCCNWSGVVCDVGGRVIGLNLSFESISDGIENSTGLFRLQHLQSLDLAWNRFNATQIPSRLASLTNLTHLNLSNAGFAGQIPVQISSLTRLVTLDLSTYSFSGSALLKLENPNLKKVVQNLTKLRELYLDGVNISAHGSEWCQALSSSQPNLQVLSLSRCFLSGPIHSSLADLHSLLVISLHQNNLSSPIPEFLAGFPNLKILRLSDCGLYGKFPEKIFQVPTLEILDLTNNSLVGNLPEFSPNMSLLILMLTGCNFTGQIPTSMANLTKLEYLDLSSNNFTGPIPSLSMSRSLSYVDLSHNDFTGKISSTDWKHLLNLVYLNLRSNSLSGGIPKSLFELPLLQKLQLDNNQFEGYLPHFSNAFSSVLGTIDLNGNRLEGSIPMSIFELKNLKILLLSSNKFNGTVLLDTIARLENLTQLDLSYNSLAVNASSSNSSFPPQLRTLRLAACKLGVFPNLKNHSKLFDLDLSDNQISGEVPNWIWNVSNGILNSVNLSHNLLKGLQEPYSIPALGVLDLRSNLLQGKILLPPSAVYVDFSSNNFTSSIPAEIGNHLNFTMFFSLSNNSLTGDIPESICNATNLRVLDLSNNIFTGRVPTCLLERGILGILNLRRNNLSGTISGTFPENCGLQTLDLNGNQLEGMVPRSLANCRMLEVLNLGNNQMDDIFPCWLKNVSNLRVLVLRSNKFHGMIGCPKIVGSWPKLQIVDLAVNNFNGSLPGKYLRNWAAMMVDEDEAQSNLKHLRFQLMRFSQELYYQDSITVTSKGLEMELVKILTLFTSIDLSCNKFQGPLPDEMGQFKSLYVLNLSRNSLTGSIPSNIGNLRQLESLDLSMNSLSGEIPQQLVRLNFLSFLNLSYNHLVGKIPLGTQIQSFSSTAFEGNEGLCGPPLSTNCTDSRKLQPSAASSSNEFDWQLIVKGIGLGIGSGAVVAPTMFSKNTNRWYDNRIDKILLVILPMVGLVYTTSHQMRIQAEETLKNENTDDKEDDYDDDGYEHETEEFHGRYCVFCSKLDTTRKKVIHDPKCTCQLS